MRRVSVVTLLLLGLMACGGGGNSTTNSPTTTQPNPQPTDPVSGDGITTPLISQSGLALYGQGSVQSNQAAGFAIKTTNGVAISDVTWTTNTPDLDLLASHTQAIGFNAPNDGTVSIQASVTLATGARQTIEFELSVVSPSEPVVDVRLDHAASEGGRVSLRADSQSTAQINNITWEQIAGPTLSDVRLGRDSSDGPTHSLFFDAPRVTQDEVIVYRATFEFDDGTSGSDIGYVLVKNTTINEDGFFPSAASNIVTSDMIPYNSDSPYAQALLDCVYNNQIEQTCTFGTLPLIGQVSSTPTIDDILDRTLVSHPWMGDRFKQFLETSATRDDMLQLLGATTAVVISYDVRPSFYWVATGAIYLDGANFWQTPEERDTLNTAPDFRSGFGSDLQFGIFWRYVQNDVYYFPQRGLTQASRLARTPEQVEAALTWLMYHELAHANDFFDYTKWASLTTNDDPLSHFRSNPAVSTQFAASFPLQSTELLDLAQVAFGGQSASQEQQNTTADDAAGYFAVDQAPAFYSYFTIREDYATLFERFMMLHRLGVSSDVAVIASGTDVVSWGQRDRVSDTLLDARTAFTVRRILPTIDITRAQRDLPEPVQLTPGLSWFDFATFESPPTPLKSSLVNAENPLSLDDHYQWQHKERKLP